MCIDDYMFFAIIVSPQAKENPYKVSQILNKMDYNLVAVQMLAMGFPPKITTAQCQYLYKLQI